MRFNNMLLIELKPHGRRVAPRRRPLWAQRGDGL
jgi:hypothetical protein